MKCEKCSFYDECAGHAAEIEACQDLMDECYDPSETTIREDREAYEVDKGDAKRKGEW